MNQILIMMLGHPGSGKSYFAKQLAPLINAVRFNGDHMRKSMFKDPEDIPIAQIIRRYLVLSIMLSTKH